jgi:hypothetical protein
LKHFNSGQQERALLYERSPNQTPETQIIQGTTQKEEMAQG